MKAKDERGELEKMLEKSPQKIDNNVPEKAEAIPGLTAEPLINVDFNQLKDKCESEARIMITNAIAMMIPDEMIETSEYIKNKMEVDVISLAGMIYQLRTNEIMQKTLMEQVNQGLAHPRMFEVFAGMSKTIGELNKQLIQTVEAIRETYRTFKQDIKEQRAEALGPHSGPQGMITTGDGGVVTRGTKELINRVKSLNTPNGYIDKEGLIPNIDDAQIIQ